jgi:hypothetical protein
MIRQEKSAPGSAENVQAGVALLPGEAGDPLIEGTAGFVVSST